MVILDIRIPGADGFEVVEAIAEFGPHVIFVTTYAEHAVRAFDVGAADYLLNPFGRERFRRALGRAREGAAARSPSPSADIFRRILSDFRAAGSWDSDRPLQRILVPDRDRVRSLFVPVEDIYWLEADGNYVRLHTRERRGETSESSVVRSTLSALEKRLDAAHFARISWNAIVNLDRVQVMHDWLHGDRIVVLEAGTELKLSRRYRKKFEG